MAKVVITKILQILILGLSLANIANAGEVTLVAADFRTADNRLWDIQVTLQHADTGWDHYADRWRVVDSSGQVLAKRVLYHPHVDEQPFTRGLSGVSLPTGADKLYVEAHDNVHGWAKQRLTLELHQAVKGYLRVTANQEAIRE